MCSSDLLPYVFVGLDIAIVLSVIGAIVGEFVGAQAGLGYLILQRNFHMDMAGVFAILIILSLMGIGLHLLVNAIQRRDYPVIQGGLLLTASALVLVNLAVDLLYAWLDPRVRYAD